MVKKAFKKVLLTKSLRKDVKEIVKAVVLSVALYEAETWTLLKEYERTFEAFEMWIRRRMDGISWQDKMTNEEAL